MVVNIKKKYLRRTDKKYLYKVEKMSTPRPFPSRGECYKFTNGSTKKIVKCLQVTTTPKGVPLAYFDEYTNVKLTDWPSIAFQYTKVECNDPIPEGYTKAFLDGGRRKNKSRRNKRKNRKTRRH